MERLKTNFNSILIKKMVELILLKNYKRVMNKTSDLIPLMLRKKLDAAVCIL